MTRRTMPARRRPRTAGATKHTPSRPVGVVSPAVAPPATAPFAVALPATLLATLLIVLAATALIYPTTATAADAWHVALASRDLTASKNPDLDDQGRYLVYQGIPAGDGDTEIILHDDSSSERSVLTANAVDDTFPRVDDGYVVWISGHGPDSEIYVQDIASGRGNRLTNNGVPDGNVRISGDFVVWVGNTGTGGTGEIYLYRISSRTTTRLTTNDYADGTPETDGSFVVWEAHPVAEDGEIFFYDGISVRQLTDNEVDDQRPVVDNRVIVWEGNDGSDPEIYLAFDGGVINVSNNTADDHLPQAFNDERGAWVAWISGDDADEDQSEIYLAHAKPGGTAFSVSRLTDDALLDLSLSLSPNGLVWMQVQTDGTAAVMHSTLEGAVTRVMGDIALDAFPAVGRDMVAFAGRAVGGDDSQVLVAFWDSTDPAATITAPADGAVLTGTSVTIRGTAADDLAVERVEVDTGDHVWRPAVIESGAGTDSVTWRLDWMLPPEADVAHTLRARVTDGAGNQAISTGNPTVRVQTAEPFSFTDVPAGHPYYDAIYGVRAADIVDGYPMGDDRWEFRPENNLWRAQFAKMICGTMKVAVDESMTSPFTDLGADVAAPSPGVDNLYPHEYVAAARTNGFTIGTSATTFSPFADINRVQVVTMLVRAVQSLHPDELDPPPAGYAGTLGLFDPAHGPTMQIAEHNGLLDGLVGFGPGWDPWAPATRGETAQLLWNLLWRD